MGGRREGMTKYDWENGMPFLPQYGGGKSFPQVFSAPIDGPAPTIPTFTDDAIFSPEKKEVFQIVALLDSVDQIDGATQGIARIKAVGTLLDPSKATFIIHGEIPAVSTSSLPTTSSSMDIIRVLGSEEYEAAGLTEAAQKHPFKRHPPLLYDPNRIRKDLGSDKRYVIVRWDRFVFASCKNLQELQDAVEQVEIGVRGSIALN